MSEQDWRREVVELARSLGWRSYYTHYSPFSTPGWPDLCLVRPPRVVLVELKTTHPRSKLNAAQESTAALLERCDRVEYHLWRPDDLGEITETLGGHLQGRLL